MSNTAMTHATQTFMAGMTPKFAVSYLRVSTRGQAERGGGNDEGFSIPAQREANKKPYPWVQLLARNLSIEAHLQNLQTGHSYRKCSSMYEKMPTVLIM